MSKGPAHHAATYVVGNKDLQRTHGGKEAHLVDGRDDGVHGLVLEWLLHYGRILDGKEGTARAILHNAIVDAVNGHDGHNVAIASVAGSLHLAVQLQANMVAQLGAKEPWLQDNGVLQFLLSDTGY